MSATKIVSVSVVIPFFGRIEELKRALDSVKNQEYVPNEIIVINDGKTGEVLDELINIQKAFSFQTFELINLPANRGVSYCRNLGWNISRAQYVAFLDDDDAWHPLKIKNQFIFMEENPSIMLSGHLHKLILECENLDLKWPISNLRYSRISIMKLLIQNQFITPSVMVRRNCRYRFLEAKRYSEDYHLWMNILINGCEISLLHQELACIFKPLFGASGLSANLLQMEIGEVGVYYSFAKSKPLLLPLIFPLTIYSFIKFIRRIIFTIFNNFKKKIK